MAESRETIQKGTIEKQIKEMKFFFTAEQLHTNVSKINKNIGIATVYRFLKDLKKNRKIHSYVCDRKSLYSLKNMNHCHFTCEVCGKIEHIKIEKIDFIKNFIDGDICHFQVEVSGLCNNCKSKTQHI